MSNGGDEGRSSRRPATILTLKVEGAHKKKSAMKKSKKAAKKAAMKKSKKAARKKR